MDFTRETSAAVGVPLTLGLLRRLIRLFGHPPQKTCAKLRPHMPTIFRRGLYRFFFYAGDRHEPYHVHVERDNKIAKFWMDPVRLQSSGGFNRKEINRIQKIVISHQTQIMECWNEYFIG